MKKIQLNFSAEAQAFLRWQSTALAGESQDLCSDVWNCMWSRSIFPAARSQGPGFLRRHGNFVLHRQQTLSPRAQSRGPWWERGSSLSRLDLAWWREVGAETGVALRCRSETSAVVLVSCGGLCLAHRKPALCSAIATKGCWAGAWGKAGWSGGSLLAGAGCQQLCPCPPSCSAAPLPNQPKAFYHHGLAPGLW